MAMHDEKYKLRDDLDMKKDSHIIKDMEEGMKKKKEEDW